MTKIRRATLNDKENCIALLREAAIWVNTKGTLLWNPDWFGDDYLNGVIAKGEVLMAEVSGKAAGMFVLQDKDETIWPDNITDNAAYIHKLCISRQFAGKGVSSNMIEHAIAESRAQGKDVLRLDCARRKALTGLYASHAFKKVSAFNMNRPNLPQYRGVRMERKL